MTPEERERMNSLCLHIQEEKNQKKFEVLLRELNELIARKERRLSGHPTVSDSARKRPWKTLSATAKRIVKTVNVYQDEKVEISIREADELFREIRIENSLTGIDGELVALKDGARIDVTLETDASETVPKMTGSRLTQ